jgi:hypothetical protein
MSLSNANHTPITGTPDVKDALNTALGQLDSAIGGIGAFDVAVIGEELADGTDSATIGSNGVYVTRNLEGLEVDSGGIVSIASDRFTPIAGTYLLLATAAMDDNHSGGRIQLYNYTQTAEVMPGMGFSLDDNEAVELMCIFTANGTDAYEIRQIIGAGGGSTLGNDDGATLGTETYLEVVLIRVSG